MLLVQEGLGLNMCKILYSELPCLSIDTERTVLAFFFHTNMAMMASYIMCPV